MGGCNQGLVSVCGVHRMNVYPFLGSVAKLGKISRIRSRPRSSAAFSRFTKLWLYGDGRPPSKPPLAA
jgi:hypothetical protein